MWPLALCLFVLSQTTALPVLPLAQSGIERLDELKDAGVGNNGPRTFIVQVQQQPQQLPAQQQPPQREFPWPYVSQTLKLLLFISLSLATCLRAIFAN